MSQVVASIGRSYLQFGRALGFSSSWIPVFLHSPRPKTFIYDLLSATGILKPSSARILASRADVPPVLIRPTHSVNTGSHTPHSHRTKVELKTQPVHGTLQIVILLRLHNLSVACRRDAVPLHPEGVIWSPSTYLS